MNKLSKFEAIAIILIIITNQIILNLANSILKVSGTSAVINSIYISIIAITFTFIICKLFNRFVNYDILDVSDFVGGKILKYIVGFLYITFFAFITSILLRYFSETLKIIYFNDVPITLIIIIFLIPALIINKYSLNVIAKLSLFFIPILMLSMIFLAYASLDKFDISQIFPIMGYSINNTFFYGITNIFAFGGLAYIFFLKPLIKNSKDFKKISLISIVLSGIFLVISVITLLIIFPFVISSDETLSIYLITKSIELGRFIQRIDAIFIFFWIFSTLCYISINIFFILNIIKKLFKVQHAKELSYSIVSIIFSLAIFIIDIAQIKFLERVVYKYFMILLIFIISFLILIFANIKSKRKGIVHE